MSTPLTRHLKNIMINTTKHDMILAEIKERTENFTLYALAGRVIGQRIELDAIKQERDALRAEVEVLRAKVDELNGIRKYHATLLSQEWQTSWARSLRASHAEVYLAGLRETSAGSAGAPAKKLLGTPIRPAILLLASSACSIAGVYSPYAVWFIIPALAFIMIALFCMWEHRL